MSNASGSIPYAVMNTRVDDKDSPDFFPTHPWATRAFFEHIMLPHTSFQRNDSILEPACGLGHMSKVLKEYSDNVESSDIIDTGYGVQRDFLKHRYCVDAYDWVITNPPFKITEEFIRKSFLIARKGVAMFSRTNIIEGIGRYNNIYKMNNPTFFAQYVERVPLLKDRLDRDASTATAYGWLVWDFESTSEDTILKWIPPSKKQFILDEDYL